MADRLASREPPGALVLQRHLDLAVDQLDRHLAVLEPAAEVLVRGHALLDHLEQAIRSSSQTEPTFQVRPRPVISVQATPEAAITGHGNRS